MKTVVLSSAALVASAGTSLAQAAGGTGSGTGSTVDFSPITQAANWSTTVIPAIMAVAGAIAVVLVAITGVKFVLGAIRRA